MSKIRILATEDDALHEEMLRIVIDKLGYELIDVVYKPSDLYLKISATKPDLLLMDIDLGNEVSGIDLTKEINDRYDIPVIYVTSFADSETFQKAKKTHPSAYIVKPYKETELQRAVELAIYNKSDSPDTVRRGRNEVVLNNHIYLKEGNVLVKVDLESIQLIEAYDKYCFIYTGDRRKMIRVRLKDLMEQLPDSLFCQAHRSYVVNIGAIEKIALSSNKITVAGKEIPVSKTYKHYLFTKLNCVV